VKVGSADVGSADVGSADVGSAKGSRTLATVFVYGTLKRGFPNFETHMKDARFLGQARTQDAFPLVIAGRWRTPYMLQDAGNGVPINGELFAVTADALEALDRLEKVGEPGGYVRQMILVARLEDTSEALPALCYLMPPNRLTGPLERLLDHYPADPDYVPPWAREPGD